MMQAQDETKAAAKRMDLRLYLRQQPVMLALVAGLGVIFFLAVAGLSRAYHTQRNALGGRWFNRAVADLNARNYVSAMNEARSALLYSPDNYGYQLTLAEALIGLKRTDEAYSYLVNLWDRQPEDGVVNLELARIAAQRGRTEQAQRYYHNAIYAVWPGDQVAKRRDTRLELIEYLLRIHSTADAQAELIALQQNLGDDPAQQEHVGDLFVRAQDYEHALATYRMALKSDPHNAAALAGAGLAAFQLGQYPLAERYLQEAVASRAGDTKSEDLLKTAEEVLRMDPFRRQISVAHRDEMVVDAFETAGQRLKSCGVASSSTPAEAQATLADSWEKMKPQITAANLRRDPDLVEEAMDLVFRIERQTNATCGAPAGTDLALLLIAKLHEGS
jgi:tetratricopeptide (TPR) repeat protein